ncbi:LuxR C-terminal-related transcriptional regulator [Streptomyces sp. NPDC060223]|uniref:helix-turn-helix transcriptional regulator n=1 Tax=unclassified Streptomyces TaxID=2593676 RepID=UPI0036363025
MPEELGRGQFEDAYRHASAVSPAGELASHVPTALFLVMDLVEAAVRTDRHAGAAAHVAAVRGAGIAAISPRLAMIVEASSAIATPRQPGARAVREGPRRPRHRPLAVRKGPGSTRLRRAPRRARSVTEARPPLTDALDTIKRLGARPWSSRTGNELRATGLSTKPAGGIAPASLTPQQREIAMLAAAGLTNKQIGEQLFLSPRTVSAHLYQLL